MKIIIKIEKRNAMIILGVCISLIAILAISGSYTNPVTHVGHDLSELGPGELAINLNVTGNLIVRDLKMDQLSINSSFNNLTNLLCEKNGTYCPQLYNNSHGTSDCLHLGGELVTDPDNSSITFCKLSGTCPSGWKKYKGWSETSRHTCRGDSVCVSGSGDCTTGSHVWSDNPTRESCYYWRGVIAIDCYDTKCEANWVYTGCY